MHPLNNALLTAKATLLARHQPLRLAAALTRNDKTTYALAVTVTRNEVEAFRKVHPANCHRGELWKFLQAFPTTPTTTVAMLAAIGGNLMLDCPRCESPTLNEVPERNAMSRADNKTYICSRCGTEEAMFDWCCSAATGHPFHSHYVTTVTSTVESLIGLAAILNTEKLSHAR
jgi:predicted RNA-binding Zn-ribbon protein involved in translation (DUF1610 family)